MERGCTAKSRHEIRQDVQSSELFHGQTSYSSNFPTSTLLNLERVGGSDSLNGWLRRINGQTSVCKAEYHSEPTQLGIIHLNWSLQMFLALAQRLQQRYIHGLLNSRDTCSMKAGDVDALQIRQHWCVLSKKIVDGLRMMHTAWINQLVKQSIDT